MTMPVIAEDPGPLARLADVKEQPNTPNVIFTRLCEGEKLKEIAKSWELPAGLFVQWFTTEHAEKYEAALKVRADELAHDALSIADEQQEVVKANGETYDPDVPRDKLRVDTRLKVAAQWDRARYGAKDHGPAGGGVQVFLDRSCGDAVAIEATGQNGEKARILIAPEKPSA